ncbi:hypothetical protein [Rhodococcus sp. JT-3]|nr:hypothetical protein [Rhodococcus sp. JT-3]
MGPHREAIVSVAAQHFDTDGYGASSINTILRSPRTPTCAPE